MGNEKLKLELSNLILKEKRFLSKNVHDNKLKQKVYEKIPDNLEELLNKTFVKAFEMVFINGTGIIEKTFDKEKISLNHDVNKFMLDYKENRANIKKIDKESKKSNFVSNVFTTSVGVGMGALGLGIPDIPVFVATVLRGIYQIVLSYGYDYEIKEEKIYILRLIRTALAKDSKEKNKYNEELEKESYYNLSLEKEINITAKVMSEALLLEKFIQGIPVVGIVGGAVNHSIYKKITNFAMIKYKKRYILNKLKEK